MPNTLAHLGVQALATRGIIRGAEPGWIWLGCILPDLPWILRRVAAGVWPDLSPYDLRLYAIVQSALLFCLIGAAAFACLSSRPRRVFAILSLGALLHLLLDATQTKWGNGVVLFAPFDWRLLNFALYWPEDWPTLALTLLGAGIFAIAWMVWRQPAPYLKPHPKSDPKSGPPEQVLPSVPSVPRHGALRLALAAGLFLIWLAGPVWLSPFAERADLHFIATLRGDDRTGSYVEFDRAGIESQHGHPPALRIWTGDILPLGGVEIPPGTARVSVRARFDADGMLLAEGIHLHGTNWRDAMSYAGLLAILLWWSLSLWIAGRTLLRPD